MLINILFWGKEKEREKYQMVSPSFINPKMWTFKKRGKLYLLIKSAPQEIKVLQM